MKVWRLVHSRHADSAFSGEGAALYGGRFNSPGERVVYTSGSLSLALLEMLAQVGSPVRLIDFVYLDAELDPKLITDLLPEGKDLPEGWDSVPPGRVSQSLGDRWLRDAASAVLRVPSVLVPGEFNYLVNPRHPDFGSILIGNPRPVPVDPRILGIG